MEVDDFLPLHDDSGIESAVGVTDYRIGEWRILVVDDDESLHAIIKLCLQSAKIDNRKLVFISAYSKNEAYEILLSDEKIDLILVDYILNDGESGFLVAKYAKNLELRKNLTVIMRTGCINHDLASSLNEHAEIDEFLEKTNSSREVLIAVLEKWLLKQVHKNTFIDKVH